MNVTAIPSVRLMALSEVDLIIDYFQGASPDFLRSLGVDPLKLPPRNDWRMHYVREFAVPLKQRTSLLVLWEAAGTPIGFSTADKIERGEQAFMHLHIVRPESRRSGTGTALLRQTASLYFQALEIKRLFCEPYAFNEAPNRTLQRAGFKYVKTHETTPGPLNFHQPVTRWVLEQ